MVPRLIVCARLAVAMLATGGCANSMTGRLGDGASKDAPPRSTVAEAVGHLCWIKAVALEGMGVRVRFTSDAPGSMSEAGVLVRFGASVSPANSGHDGCTVTALRRGGVAGVEAEAQFFDAGTMASPQIRREWIVAAPHP